MSKTAEKKIQDALEYLTSQTTSAQIDIAYNICIELLLVIKSSSNKKLSSEKTFKRIKRVIVSKTKERTKEEILQIKKIMVLKLASDIFKTLSRDDLTEDILLSYYKSFERLANYLMYNSDDDYEANGDFFKKDIFFVLGLHLPFSSFLIGEAPSYILYRSIVRSFLRGGNSSALYMLLFKGGSGPWFRYHVDERDLSDFHETGWDESYKIIAHYLKKNPSIVGIVGTSWFYDPQIPDVSSHLAYLQKRQLERGAFIVRHGTDENSIYNATLKSEKRKKLYEEGKYIPISCSLFWHRDDLLKWAENSYR